MQTSLIVAIIISVIVLIGGVVFGLMTLKNLPTNTTPKPLPFKFNTVPPPVLSTATTSPP